jgi:hypothetical protein
LFVGNELVPPPYDYVDKQPGNDAAIPNQPPDTTKFVRVEAWIAEKTLAKNQSVTFRVPFCGTDFIASQPLSFTVPSITRLGGDETTSVFRIAHPLGFSSSVSVELDRTYGEGGTELVKSSDVDYRFQVSTSIARQYENIIVRIGSTDPYLLSMPKEPRPVLHPTIINDDKPARIARKSRGPVEWSGSGLDGITGVLLYTDVQAGGVAASGQDPLIPGVPADFAIYDLNKRIEVYFSDGSTAIPCKASVEFTTVLGAVIRMPMYILPDEVSHNPQAQK